MNCLVAAILYLFVVTCASAIDYSFKVPSGFQHFFATVRMCVETRPVSICLGRHADERIARPGTDLSRDELAQALEEDPKLMHIFKSCFSQNAKVDMASAELGFVDIRTGRYTCELRRRAGVWRVVSFYDSLGGC